MNDVNELERFWQRPPSPFQPLGYGAFGSGRCAFWLKRDDLLHPHVSGNKWRKLKHNLLEARRLGLTRLATFGGAYSNHLAAVAAAGRLFGFSTIGVVGAEAGSEGNPTLKLARECGMDLRFTSRANMRNLSGTELLRELKIDTTGIFILPQGGANCNALVGCREIVEEIEGQLGHQPDFIITACGTGATLAGIAAALRSNSQALGVAVLKGGFLQSEVERLLANCGQTLRGNCKVQDGFHFGGYAKWTPELIRFVNDFKAETGIPLDPIYTGKAFYAAMELAEQGHFADGSSIVLLHTGGLQGIAGFNERFGALIA